MKLSRSERWILANQFRIMSQLDRANADYYAGVVEALERGYAASIDRYGAHILRDDTNAEECAEVDDILAMYHAMQRSFRTLDDPFGIEEWQLRFPGFDGATEGDYLGYARFVIQREKRYSYFDAANDVDTKLPMLRIYRRMLGDWKDRRYTTTLTRDDIVALVAAQKRK